MRVAWVILVIVFWVSLSAIFILHFLGCAGPKTETTIKYVKEVPVCEGLTSELIAYTQKQAKSFFGDDIEITVYVNTSDALVKACGGVACWTPYGIGLSCQDKYTMCSALLHELGRQEAYNRFGTGAASDAENIFPVFYQQWQSYPCFKENLEKEGL